MKETETDHSLLEEIAILSSRRESGRLQITAGATRGAFFFKQGKLVDARMGPFTGFPAINLAVSIGETHHTFDPSIQPPTSSFNEVNERTLLRERFGIDTLDAEEAHHQTSIADTGEDIFEATWQGLRPEATFPQENTGAPQKDETEAIKEWDDSGGEIPSSAETNQFLTRPGAVFSIMKAQQSLKTLTTVSLPYRVWLKQSLTYNTRERFLIRAGFILLIVIPAAVVTASYWSKGKQTPALEASRTATAEALLTPSAPSHDARKSIPTTKPVRAEAKPSPLNAKAPMKIEEAKTLPAEIPVRTTKGITNSASDAKAIEDQPADKPSSQLSSRAVAVVVKIEEGHVTEAYIQNPQVGLGAYEATALRIARQRRYPRDTKRKETVILQVAPER